MMYFVIIFCYTIENARGGAFMDPVKKLRRSRDNKVIAGVCGGVAEYFNIDPVIVRILAIVIPGFGWVAYLICAVIIPAE